MSASSNGEGYRTLADQLRAWSDDRLSQLLRERPDLGTPAPHDSSQLAARAATRSSVVRALDRLSRFELCVLDALVVGGQTPAPDLPIILHADPEAVTAALDRLVDLALVWHAKGGLRALTDVADALTGGEAGGVSGLFPVSPDAPSPAEVERRLAELSPAARAMLEHVEANGGQATTEARQTVLPEDASGPAEELLSRRLLVPRGGGTVLVPGEVGLALRGGRTTREPVDAVPSVASSPRDQAHVDRTAAGAAFEAVRRVELLLDHWGTEPPACLRSGGLGVRDLRAAATLLHVDERTAGLLVELSATAGLLAEGLDAQRDPVWLPTDAFDGWLDRPVADRWASLVRAWLETSRLPGLVGSRDQAGKARNALAPDLSSVFAAESRRMALEALATLPAGEVLATGTGVASVVSRVLCVRNSVVL
jgi:hypothetical protein